MKLLKLGVLLLVVFIVYFDAVMTAQALSWKSVEKTVKKYTSTSYLKDHQKEIVCTGVSFAVERAVPSGGSAEKRLRDKAIKRVGNKIAKELVRWSVGQIAYYLCMEYGPKIVDEFT